MHNPATTLEKITLLLKEFESRGDVVITTTTPSQLAREIYALVIKAILDDTSGFEEPIEFSLPFLLDEIAAKVQQLFSVDAEISKHIVGAYHQQWLTQRTPQQIAELYWHQGYHDMALRAYYSVFLGKDNLATDYLDWRKQYS